MKQSTKSIDGGGSRIATELENCVLGIIAEHQPCTAYAVRRQLGISLSSYWSGSTGAIYPLLKRLKEREWIQAEEQEWGTRMRRSFSLTRSGRRRFHEWLSPPVAPWVAAFTYDPIRTRVFFLGHLPLEQQLGFLDDAIAETKKVLREHQAEKNAMVAERSVFDSIGRDGAIAELKARLRWLERTHDKAASSGE